jgi:hypothetical protein
MPAIDRFELQFKLEFRDFFLFTTIHQFMNPVIQLLCGGLAIYIVSSEEGSLAFRIVVGAFWYLLMWTAQILLSFVYLRAANNRTILTTYAIVIDKQAVYSHTPFAKGEFYWPGVLRIVMPPGFVALYVNGHAALLIPNRAFSSAGERTDLVNLVRSKM